MSEHLARAYAAFDWQDEIAEEAILPDRNDADCGLETPWLGETETIASLRCPVGRVRTRAGEAAALRRAQASRATAGDPDRATGGQVRTPVFAGGMANPADRSVPMDRPRDTPPDIRRMAHAFAGRMRGLTNTS